MTMKIYETRRAILKQLINEKFEASQTKFAAKVDKQPDYISRCLSGKKNIGEEIAREFEEKTALPEGFLDGRANTPVLTPEEAEWLALRRNLTTELRAVVFKMGNSLIEPEGNGGDAPKAAAK